MADGTITIDTRIDTNGIAAGTEEVKKAVKRMASSVSKPVSYTHLFHFSYFSLLFVSADR